jgi:putative endonuclease
MEYFVYVIRNKNGRTYVGMSSNPDKRIIWHNLGYVRSTKSFRPWYKIYVEKCGSNRRVARSREKYFKSGVGKEFLKNNIL